MPFKKDCFADFQNQLLNILCRERYLAEMERLVMNRIADVAARYDIEAYQSGVLKKIEQQTLDFDFNGFVLQTVPILKRQVMMDIKQLSEITGVPWLKSDLANDDILSGKLTNLGYDVTNGVSWLLEHSALDETLLVVRQVRKTMRTIAVKPFNDSEVDGFGLMHWSGRFNSWGALNGRTYSHDLPLSRINDQMKQHLVAGEGYRFVQADFKSAELVALAYASNDQVLQADIQTDVYKKVASVGFGLPIDRLNDYQRKIGKSALIKLVYGMKPENLINELDSHGDPKLQASRMVEWMQRTYESGFNYLDMVAKDDKIHLMGHRTEFSNAGYRKGTLVNASVASVTAMLLRHYALAMQALMPTWTISNLVFDSVWLKVPETVTIEVVQEIADSAMALAIETSGFKGLQQTVVVQQFGK